MNKHTASSASFLWRSVILGLALIMNLTLAWRLVWGGQSVSAWRDLKNRQTELMQELEQLDRQRAVLSREIRLLQTDSSYVEKVIRQRLNYVRANEILYLFDSRNLEDSLWTGADDAEDTVTE